MQQNLFTFNIRDHDFFLTSSPVIIYNKNARGIYIIVKHYCDHHEKQKSVRETKVRERKWTIGNVKPKNKREEQP